MNGFEFLQGGPTMNAAEIERDIEAARKRLGVYVKQRDAAEALVNATREEIVALQEERERLVRRRGK